ncbi:MAG: hypothetical protein IPO50_05490 [Sphingomonadales bacterium]|nr:hypothetical protein [Sphingomonadales bacterium]
MQAHPGRITILNRGNYLTFKAIRDAEVPVVVCRAQIRHRRRHRHLRRSDTIIAADDAFFSLPEVDRGAMGGASHLSRMLPLHKVRAAFFTGGNISAQEAYRLGAVERSCRAKSWQMKHAILRCRRIQITKGARDCKGGSQRPRSPRC